MSILANARAHFKRGRQELLNLEVPEWGADGKPAIIYFYPITSVEERAQIQAAMSESVVRGMMTLLCVRARDADGKLLFPIAGLDMFVRELDADVVAETAARITDKAAKYSVSAEDIKKE